MRIPADPTAGVEIVCRSRGGLPGDLRLKQMVQDEVLRLRDFSAATVEGIPLEVVEERDRGMGSGARQFAERIVHTEGASEVVYTYRIGPGAPAGDPIRGSYGRRFGHLDTGGGLLSGRNLFLLPAWHQAIADIEVTFELPPGWRVVGSLPIRGDTAVLRGATPAAAILIEAVIGVGRFAERKAATSAGVLHVFIRDDLSRDTQEEVFEVARRGLDILGRRLGPLGRDYTVVMIPPPADGSLVLVPPSSSAQGGEIASAGPAQTYDMIQAMTRAWIDPPVSPPGRQWLDGWVAESLPDLFAIQAVDSLGIRPGRESWLLRARQARQARIPLEGPPSGAIETRQERRVKGSFLLALLDERLRGPAAEGPGLDAVVPRLREEGGELGLFEILGRGSPQDWSSFQELAASAEAIPEAALARLSYIEPLSLDPPPPGTRGARGRRLRLVVTANTRGMLEVCGCVARQLGGIARRETIRRRLLGRREPVVMVDLGNAYAMDRREPLAGRVELREMDLYLELLGRQHYAAAAIGHTEMMRGPRFFRETADRRPLPYVNANLRMGDDRLAPPWRLTSVGGIRIAWVSALDPRRYVEEHARFYEQRVDGLRVEDPVDTLAAAAREVRERADLVIVIGSLPPVLVRALLDGVPELDAILSTESPAAALDGVLRFPTGNENTLIGWHDGRLVFFGTGEGRWLEQIDITLAPGGGIARAELKQEVLSERISDAPDFRARMAAFYDGMRDDPELSGSGEPVARFLPAVLKSDYVGAAACKDCHAPEAAAWETSAHGRAFSTLVKRHRNYAPRCIGCHVTGYGHPSGYRLGDPLERLRHVQCEMCHGPGAAHVREPSAVNVHRRPRREVCFECHTPQHSDMNEENFSDYYTRAAHRLPDPRVGAAAGGAAGGP